MLFRLLSRFTKKIIAKTKLLLSQWHILTPIPTWGNAGISEAAFNQLPEDTRNFLDREPLTCQLMKKGILTLNEDNTSAFGLTERNALKKGAVYDLLNDRYLKPNTFLIHLPEEAFDALNHWQVENFLRQNGHSTPEKFAHFSRHAWLALKHHYVRSLIKAGLITDNHLARFTEDTVQALKQRWVRQLIRQGFPVMDCIAEPTFSLENLEKNTLIAQYKGRGENRYQHSGIRQLLKKQKLSTEKLATLSTNALNALKHRGTRLLVQDGFMTIEQLETTAEMPDALALLHSLSIRQKLRKPYFCIQDLIDNTNDLRKNLHNKAFRTKLKLCDSDSMLTLPTRALIRTCRPVRYFLKKGWITIDQLNTVPTGPTKEQAAPLQLFRNKTMQKLIRKGYLKALWVWQLPPEAAHCFPPGLRDRLNLAKLIEDRYLSPKELDTLSPDQWKSLSRYHFRLLIKEGSLSMSLFKELTDQERDQINNSLDPHDALATIKADRALTENAYLVTNKTTDTETKNIENSWNQLNKHHTLSDDMIASTLNTLETDLNSLPNDKENHASASGVIQTIRALSKRQPEKTQDLHRLALLTLAIKAGKFKTGSTVSHVLSIFANALMLAKTKETNWQLHSLSFLAPYLEGVNNPQLAPPVAK